MKKGKVLSKGQIAVGVLIVGLAAAIWLNSKYLPSSTKYLGEASYVSNTKDSSAVATSAKAETDYFKVMKNERDKARENAISSVEEMLDTKSLSDEEKSAALEKTEKIANDMKNEADIEALLKAKGFKKSVAMIGDDDVNIIVSSNGLTGDQTLVIQDIVVSKTKISIDKIKIVPVKE